MQKLKKLQKLISELRKKTRQNRKTTKGVLHAEKHRMCTLKIQKSKYTHTIKQSYRILEITVVC